MDRIGFSIDLTLEDGEKPPLQKQHSEACEQEQSCKGPESIGVGRKESAGGEAGREIIAGPGDGGKSPGRNLDCAAPDPRPGGDLQQLWQQKNYEHHEHHALAAFAGALETVKQTDHDPVT